MSVPREFPISPVLPGIVASLATTPRLVLEAPPGAGKTTQVPLALLDAPWLDGRILMLEPRRIAARAAAEFMASQRGEAVGETVGYRIRNDSKVGPKTRIEVVTEAILTRMLQDDPELPGVGAILFDEFHERHLHGDLGLALALEVQQALRPDLRLLVMSATLDGERLSAFLGSPRITSPGRSFPVDVEHVPAKSNEDELFAQRRAVLKACDETDGDVLVFLPGKREIDRLGRALAEPLAERNIVALELHGELELAQQRAVLAPPKPGERRVVLSTNVAESSVTLPAVRAVVDSGLAREPRFDPSSGMSRLETVNISQASATQRAGRAGRVAPGRCYRLWPQSLRLEPSARPELAKVELSQLALELAAWGDANLRWLDAPPPGPLAEARARLQKLGALDEAERITAHGRALLALGTHPRLAHMLLDAPRELASLACDVAALVEARDPLFGEARRSDDLRSRIDALHRYRRDRRAPPDSDRYALMQIDQQAAQWRRRLRIDANDMAANHFAVGRLLALAFPDRIAHQTRDDVLRYQLSSGRGARLFPGSKLHGESWIVASEIRFEERDALIQKGAPVDEDFLRRHFAAQFRSVRHVAFNRDTGAVETHDEKRFDELVLERRQQPTTRDAETARQLAVGLAQLGANAWPWTDNLRQWQARVESLRGWMPEANLTECSDEGLASSVLEWLAPFLDGKARVSELDAATFGRALTSRLDYAQQRLLDEQAPVALTVPSGQSRRLDYRPGHPPALAVKLQEMFGLADTPRVANGRVPVTLELLSPAQRPIQVTQDLRGFWERTYPEVRKELKGRYPRHPWPDDPWNAVPTHRAKPRGS